MLAFTLLAWLLRRKGLMMKGKKISIVTVWWNPCTENLHYSLQAQEKQVFLHFWPSKTEHSWPVNINSWGWCLYSQVQRMQWVQAIPLPWQPGLQDNTQMATSWSVTHPPWAPLHVSLCASSAIPAMWEYRKRCEALNTLWPWPPFRSSWDSLTGCYST